MRLQSKGTPVRVRLLTAFAAMLWVCTLHASPITFSFTGAVTDDPFGLSSFGAPISGSYTFDSASTDSIPSPSTGSYASVGPGFGFRANVDGTMYSVLGTTSINTANNITGVDQYGAIAIGGGLTLEIFFQDATATALSNDGLPLVPPLIAAFGFRQFRLFSDDAEFLGSVTSLTCTAGCSTRPVPEPASPWLLAAAALAMTCLMQRRKLLIR
jgi:MYXO-CTERM domain-containing protein